MNRVDELTNAVLDGTASDDEIAELQRLVSSAEAREAYLGLVEAEGELRARGPAADVARDTMARIRSDLRREVSANVMRKVRRISARRAARPVKRIAAALAVAAALVVGVLGIVLNRYYPGAGATSPRIASRLPAERARPGLEVTTGPVERRMFVYPDGTTVILGSDSHVTFETATGRKRLVLAGGSLEADVAPQAAVGPMQMVTPTTELTIAGTRLLLAEGRGGTLLNVEEGSVLFVNIASRRAVTVVAGRYCIGTSTGTTMTTARADGVDALQLARLVLTPPDRGEHEERVAPPRARPPEGVGDNLLTNTNFARWDDEGPRDWRRLDDKQRTTRETAPGHPTAATALRVDVIRDDHPRNHYGQVLQAVRVKPGTRYVLSGDIRSSRSRSCFYEVKLRYRRKELSRIDTDLSTTTWRRVSIEFDTGSADNVLILCRYRQKPEYVGVTSWWTDVSLRLAADDE